MLTEEHLIKFQELYKRHFGKDIDRQDALEKASKLLQLMRIIYKPIAKNEFERFYLPKKGEDKTKL